MVGRPVVNSLDNLRFIFTEEGRRLDELLYGIGCQQPASIITFLAIYGAEPRSMWDMTVTHGLGPLGTQACIRRRRLEDSKNRRRREHARDVG